MKARGFRTITFDVYRFKCLGRNGMNHYTGCEFEGNVLNVLFFYSEKTFVIVSIFIRRTHRKTISG